MRRIVVLAGVLIFCSIIGYFMYLNNHKVPFVLIGSYTLHFSMWLLIFIVFFSGLFLAWFYQLLFHPDRLLQRIKYRWVHYQNGKREQKLRDYFEAGLRCDFKAMRTAFRRMERSDELPLHIRVHYLKKQRFKNSSASVMEGFHQLKEKFPGNLQVLLPYQKLALEIKEWSIAELLSQEILNLEKNHPDGLEGLRQIHLHRGEWEKCLQVEIKLLARFPQSVVAESLLARHETHVLKGMEQNPELLSQVNFNHIPGKASSFKKFHRVTLILAEAEQMRRSGKYEQAANLLKRAYEKNAAPVLLDRLDSMFYQVGLGEKVLSILRDLQRSSAANLYVDLVRARIHYKMNHFDQARTVLSRLSGQNPRPSVLYHALDYLLAIRENDPVRLNDAAKSLVPGEDLLENLYSCSQCGTVGNWQSVCHRCNHLYSYVHRDHLC